MFDIKLLVAFVFLFFSALLIFNSQNRTSIVTSLIIIHLNLIVFFSLTITNQNLFKEIILTLILYLIAVLFVITNQEDVKKTIKKIKVKRPSFWVISFAAIAAIVIFICGFILTNKAFYQMKKMRENNIIITQSNPQMASADDSLKERRKLRLAKKLQENYLLKHSSDVILIIVFLSGFILLFSSYNLKNKK